MNLALRFQQDRRETRTKRSLSAAFPGTSVATPTGQAGRLGQEGTLYGSYTKCIVLTVPWTIAFKALTEAGKQPLFWRVYKSTQSAKGMTYQLYLGRDGELCDAENRIFNAWDWQWERPVTRTSEPVQPVDVTTALSAVLSGGSARRLPVGIIGPREATVDQEHIAEQIGRRLAHLGLTIMCGGRGGVMAAAAKGARCAGGLTIGILPGQDWRSANSDIVVPVATGLGEARNAIIARASVAIVAVGSSHGTLTEIAFGLHFARPVIGIAGAPDIAGLELVNTVDDVVDRVSYSLLVF